MKKWLTLALIEQSINSGSSFIFTILLARSMSEEVLGIFFSFNLFYLLCQSIQHSVISAPAYSLVARLNEISKGQTYFKFLVMRQMVLSLLFVSVYTWICLIFIRSEAKWISLIVCIQYGLVLLFLLAFDFARKWFIANQRYRNLVVFSSVRYFIQFAGIVLLSRIDIITLNGLGIILLLAPGVSLISAVVDKNSNFNLNLYSYGRLDRKTASQHQKAALDLLPGAIMQWTSGGTYELQALKVLGPSVFAVIKVVQSFVSPLNIINQFAENWMIVFFAPKKSGGKELNDKEFSVRLLVGVAFILTIIISAVNLVAPYLLTIFYGPEYFDYGFMVTGYLIVVLLVILNTTIRSYLTANLSTTIIKFAYGASTAFAVGCSYLLVQKFNLHGVIFGAISSQLILLVSMITYKQGGKRKLNT